MLRSISITIALLLSVINHSLAQGADSIRFDFVGGGDLQKLTQNVKNNTTANLSFGMHFQRKFTNNGFFKNIDVDMAFNVASTADSLGVNTNDVREFGSFILNPINSRQSVRFDFMSLLQDGKTLDFLFDGIYFKFRAANKFISNSTVSSHLATIHYRLGIFHEFVPDDRSMADNTSVMLGIGFASRGIYGDINQMNRSDLIALFGVDRNRYRALELFFGVKLNDLKAEVTIPFIANGKKEVKGLTGTQPIISVRFVGGFSVNNQKSAG